MLCVVDTRLGATPETLDLVTQIEAGAVDSDSKAVGADFAVAIARSRWVILAGSYLEPSTLCYWAVFDHDDFSHVVRSAVRHHLAVVFARGVDARRALGFSIAPYSHAYQRLHDAMVRYQTALRVEAPQRVQ